MIVVQARTGSTRLPGKVLKPLAGAPAIVRVMQRVARVRFTDRYVVATSTEPADDPLVEACREHDIPVVRGPLDDVLARVVAAVPPEFGAAVRLTADCPLLDPALVDHHIRTFCREWPWADYVSNTIVRTQPDGLDVEVVRRDRLIDADQRATSPFDREHVLPWIRRRARMVPVTQEVDLSRLRWTLDTPDDYAAISAVYEALHGETPGFDSRDVYRLLLRRPDLIRVEGEARLTQAERDMWVSRIRSHLAVVETAE